MKKLCITYLFSLVIMIQAVSVSAGQLPAALEQYRDTVTSIRAAETDGEVKVFLGFCLSATDQLNGLEASDPRASEVLSNFSRTYRDTRDKLSAQARRTPGARAEFDAYVAHIQPLLKSEYITLIALQDRLLERKYFKTETSKNANFLEGIANSYLPFTRTDHGDVTHILTEPHLGVSPWEAIFRLEPAIAMEHGVQAAFMGTAGMSYTFFPDVERTGLTAVMHENFWSKWMQKSGGRIGIGAGNMDNHVRLLLGVGAQVNALGIWGMYRPDNGAFLFGLSASDLSPFKKVISWFD